MLEKISSKFGIEAKVAVIIIIVIANAFTWYFYAFDVLRQVVSEFAPTFFESVIIWGTNFAGIAVSAILGGFMKEKLRRRMPFLLFWMFVGVLISPIPLAVDLTQSVNLILISAVFGSYFGFGMPIAMGFFADHTVIENRGRMGGMLFLFIGLGFFLLGSANTSSVVSHVLILATWRGAALLILLLLKPTEKPQEKRGDVSYVSVLTKRSFFLYFIPWCMFSLINNSTVPVLSGFFGEEFVRFSSMIENVLLGISAVLGGFLADFSGRKRLATTGFVLLGLGYAVLGIFPQFELSWVFYAFVDGIAWGTFYTIFLMAIWGDVSQGQSSEKHYALGSLPFLFSNLVRLVVGPQIAQNVVVSTVFSLAAFFLFLAVLPLIYAPETLPKKSIEKRQLKMYIKKAREIAAE